MVWLLIDIVNSVRGIADRREGCDRACSSGRLRFEAHADGEIGIEGKGAKDLPMISIEGLVKHVGLVASRDSEVYGINLKMGGVTVIG